MPYIYIYIYIYICYFHPELSRNHRQPTTSRNIKQNRFQEVTSCELKIWVRARQKWDCNISTLLQSHHQTELSFSVSFPLNMQSINGGLSGICVYSSTYDVLYCLYLHCTLHHFKVVLLVVENMRILVYRLPFGQKDWGQSAKEPWKCHDISGKYFHGCRQDQGRGMVSHCGSLFWNRTTIDGAQVFVVRNGANLLLKWVSFCSIFLV